MHSHKQCKTHRMSRIRYATQHTLQDREILHDVARQTEMDIYD